MHLLDMIFLESFAMPAIDFFQTMQKVTPAKCATKNFALTVIFYYTNHFRYVLRVDKFVFCVNKFSLSRFRNNFIYTHTLNFTQLNVGDNRSK